MSNLQDLALFVSIVEEGSLAAAARSAGLPKSSVSRRLLALEKRLNTRLIQRSTRKLGLTDAGHRLYDRCAPLVAEAVAAEKDVMSDAAEPTGTLRVTATGAFGRLYAGPLLGEFLAVNRALRAELVLLDRTVNLIEEGFDLALRMGHLEDSNLMSRTLGTFERFLCASPEYLKRAPALNELRDIKQHEALQAISGNRWSFVQDAKPVTVTASGRFNTNQIEILHSAAVCGCGLAILPRFLVLDDFKRGSLVNLLPETPPTPGAVHALWPSNRHVSARTRLFVEFLAERLRQPGVWDLPILQQQQQRVED